MATDKIENKFFTYKDKPLVASGNTLYYGDPNQKYILALQINSTKPLEDLSVPTQVQMSLILTDPSIGFPEKIIKSAQKDSITSALDVGIIWLELALKKD